jgi:pimeloyl-ACP methyl ester carboxylesterase
MLNGRVLTLVLLVTASAFAEDFVTTDHYVQVTSKVPAIEGQTTQIYVREIVEPRTVLRGGPLENRVVLFIHGAGTPAQVAFDAPYDGYSWMKHIARAGFDTFSMDMTGYGRSTRPTPMNDPCNLSEAHRAALTPGSAPKPCEASYTSRLTTIESDWDDIDTVIEHLKEIRGVDEISLFGWSLGGPRAGGYAARHPEKVNTLVLLAPAYQGDRGQRPDKVPADGPVMSKQSRSDFDANWARQVGCADQFTPAVSDAVWVTMLESDPVGATWGTGVRRAPLVTSWGFGNATVTKMTTPALLFAGVHDAQVPIERVEALYRDLGSKQKVFVDLACSSHNAMWETNRLLMFDASVEWLTSGTVEGQSSGEIRLGY